MCMCVCVCEYREVSFFTQVLVCHRSATSVFTTKLSWRLFFYSGGVVLITLLPPPLPPSRRVVCSGPKLKALAAALGDGRAPDLIDLNLSDNPGVLEEGTAALVRQRRRPPAALRRVWEDGGRGMGPRV